MFESRTLRSPGTSKARAQAALPASTGFIAAPREQQDVKGRREQNVRATRKDTAQTLSAHFSAHLRS
jgi:hypothetical protein